MTKMLRLAKWGSQNKDSRRANSREEGLSLEVKSAKVERHVEKNLSQLLLAESSGAAMEPEERCSFKWHQA